MMKSNNKNQTGTFWYTYMQLYMQHSMEDGQLLEQPSVTIMKALGIKPEEIKTCVEQSFEEPGNFQSDNRILKEDRHWSRIMSVREHPIITINNHTYHGEMTGPDIARAICVSFKDRPKYCTKEAFTKLIEEATETPFNVKINETTDTQLIFAALIILLVNVGMIYIHKKGNKKKQKTEIQLEVNAAVS